MLLVGMSFLISLVIEFFILRIFLRKTSWQTAARATLVANVVSYVLVTPVLLLSPYI